MIFTLPSVLPPSMTIYSRLGYFCRSTERMVCSMNLSWLNEGVMTLMRGQGSLPGAGVGDTPVSSVQGQPDLSLGAGGRTEGASANSPSISSFGITAFRNCAH